MKSFKFLSLNILFTIVLILLLSDIASASTTDGTIDSVNHSALFCVDDTCSTTTQINFKTTTGNPVHVTDTAVTGNAWSETFGWINLNPTHGGVTNTSSGVLGGYAWGENSGWINFGPTNGGVTINSSGEFTGWAWAQNYGWIRFNCSVANACVETDWRPLSTRNNNSGSSSGSSTLPIISGEILDQNPPLIISPIPPVTPPVTNVTPSTNPTNPSDQKNSINPTTFPPDDNSDYPLPLSTTDPSSLSNQDTNNSRSAIDYIKNLIASILGDLKDGSRFAITQNTIGDLIKKINIFSFETRLFIKDIVDETYKIFQDPTGKIVTSVVSTAGVVTGLYFGVVNVAFANPLTFTEIFLTPMRLWTLLLVALGIKKRKVPWGIVYDSVTKQPLDPAYVVLQDLNGNEIATSITDLDGRYGFLVPPGQYKLLANKTNYEFPSKKLSGRSKDELYSDLYFSEVIDVQDGGVITKNIPMDPLKFDWNEFAKRDKKLMRFFSRRELVIARFVDILFAFGFIFTIISTLISPVIYNIIILAIYLFMIMLQKTILKPRAFGHIKEKITKSPLSFAIIRVFFSGSDSEVIHKVADERGKYYCLIPNGTYYTKIERKDLDQSYSLVYTSESIEVKNGHINKIFEV